MARLGEFFEVDLRSLDGGAIEAEVVSSNIRYLYQLAEDACEEGEGGEGEAQEPAPPKPASSGWWVGK